MTWGNGTAGLIGPVSAENSLVGTAAGEEIGFSTTTIRDPITYPSVIALTNGNYVVGSPDWSNVSARGAGAATWGNGVIGINGPVSAANSLVGKATNDDVGRTIVVLVNGNYVVGSPGWGNGSAGGAGAVTLGNGATGITGPVSAANSLVGTTTGDHVGNTVTALTNGNYVVGSPGWSNGSAGYAGAATWGNGVTGITGPVSAANSLVGTTADDSIGFDEIGNPVIVTLTNGNYVVGSPMWDNGLVVNAGAATWGSGAAGTSGPISDSNSLVGTTAYDEVGYSVALTNGNYVVSDPGWNNGSAAQAGAATWGNGATGRSGVVSAANSLVGTTTNDQIGTSITALTNGNYVVSSPGWRNGSTAGVGAATWGNGATGATGVVSGTNSLIGTTAGDEVGSQGIVALDNGNYLVGSPGWHNGAVAGAGAATWGNGATGTTGVVSAANSLFGTTAGDEVGSQGIVALDNGNYLVDSPGWHYGTVAGAGAVTLGNGTGGVSGPVSAAISQLGMTSSSGLGTPILDDVNGTYLTPFVNEGVVLVGSQTGLPTITGINPASGPLSGGTLVTITGTFLTGVTSVDFGAVSVSSFIRVNDTQIVLDSPPGELGTVDVQVHTSAGVSAVSPADHFTYTWGPSLVGYPRFTVGADANGPATVTVYNPDQSVATTLTLFLSTSGGVRVAEADFNGDGIPDLAVGTGPGAVAEVKVYDGATGATLFDILPFESSFTGGVFVAAGDVNGDGKADLAITPDEGGGPRVRVFDGAKNFAQINDFFGIDDPNFRGGARAAVGDINGDGRSDVVVAAGFGGGPRVAFYDGAQLGPTGGPKLVGDFFVFEQSLRNGVFIASGDLNGDGYADIIAGGGPGGGPRVFALSGKDLVQSDTQTPVANFFAGDVNSRGGIRVSVKNLDGDAKADLVVGAGDNAGSTVTGYLGANILPNGTPPDQFSFNAFPGYGGGVFVG